MSHGDAYDIMKSDYFSQFYSGVMKMNAKFFDLKKEKQDRMINAAIKLFALNGYTHASTDDIVKEAHISKGLLFHYFESKIGVYTFVYDYIVKYYSLELSGAIDPDEADYFELRKQVEIGKMQTLKAYPYMSLFLSKCFKETVPEATAAIKDSMLQYENNLGTIMARADWEAVRAVKNNEMLINMLDSTLDTITEKHLRSEDFDPEALYKESIAYIDLVAGLFR